MSRPVLLFRAGALLCGLPLEDVVEIMRPMPVRPLVDTPAQVRGVSVVRGRPVPVVDLALLLGDDGGEAIRFVTVRGERGDAVLMTGEILGITDVGLTEPPPADSSRPVAAVSVHGSDPLLLLRGASLVPEAAWAAVGEKVPLR